MVHALQEIWRVLQPQGCFIDIRPIQVRWVIEVVSGKHITQVGKIEDTLRRDDINAANRALQTVLNEQLFIKEHIEYFNYHWYWDTLSEMIAYLDEHWYARLSVPQELLNQIALLLGEGGSGAQVRLTRRMVIARYRQHL